MDKALKQAKPQLQVSAKDGKVIIIGNQEGLDLLARIVSVAFVFTCVRSCRRQTSVLHQ